MYQTKFFIIFIAFQGLAHSLFAQNYYAKERFDKGEIELHVGSFGEAIKYYDQAIRSYPNYTIAFFSRGKAHYHLSQYTQAMKDFKKVFDLDSKRIDALFYQGVVAYQEQDYEKALDILNDALERDAYYAIAYNYRAECYRELGLNSQAIRDYAQAITLDSLIPVLYVGRGKCYLANENYTKAIQDFSKAIELEPRKLTYYRYRAEAQYLNGAYSLASKDMDYLSQQTEAEIQEYEYRLNAFCKASIQDYAGATYVMTQLLRKAPNDVEALTERAVYFMEQGKSAEAIQDYEKALKLQPENTENRLACARLYMLTKQYQVAQPHLRAALEKNLEDAEIWYLLGLSHYQLEENSLAKPHLIKAAQLGYPREKMPKKVFRLARKGYRK